jgi:hypothetical protein
MATWAGRPTTILGWLDTSWLSYKSVAKGSLLFHPTSSQATSNFLNPSPSSSQGSFLASFITCNLSTQPFVSFHPFG